MKRSNGLIVTINPECSIMKFRTTLRRIDVKWAPFTRREEIEEEEEAPVEEEEEEEEKEVVYSTKNKHTNDYRRLLFVHR
ncbi:hypothetical protein HZH68_001391 [Vespula germanica]|uniref:Uncharacterized protein n=1 Tax=Vespula germanica TaxID=30212 RepID=A0A834NVH5_VESGE|nr:hypothetical protein HZH68_001391 [Vespula germanica]